MSGLIDRLAPRAHAAYREALDRDDLPERAFGAHAQRRLRLVHFLAQCCHETAGLTLRVESLYYTTPERLMAVWPTRFRTRTAALPYVRNPSALASRVYGGRMGNVGPEDGWRYIGRGLLQITGRDMYARVGAMVGLDLERDPDLAADPHHLLAVGLAVWRLKDCDRWADADDVVEVTRAINGGLIGLSDRRAWLAKAKDALGA